MKYQILIVLLIFLLALILRTYKLGEIPRGFYSDESLYGYEAYSILKTGADQYGNTFPLVFKAFGDYRPGLIVYATVPFIGAFGLTEFATRLPSALFSALTSIVIFFLGMELWRNFKAATLASLIFAISPWSIQFARMAHEANLATFLVVLSTYLFIKGSKISWCLILSFILFSISVYAYYNTRIFVPLFLVTLLIIFRDKVFNRIKYFLAGLVLMLILLLPLFIILFNREVGWSRIDAVSLWGDVGIVLNINEARGEDKLANQNLSKFFHNKIADGLFAFTESFLSHFDPKFLFLHGDSIKIYQTPKVGILLFVEAILIFVAIFSIWKKSNPYSSLLFLWLILGLLPDTLTRSAPAAARIHLVLPLVSLIDGLGMQNILVWVKKKQIVWRRYALLILVLVIIWQLSYFIHQNFVHSQVRYAKEWHYGLKKVIKEVESRQDMYEQVWVAKSGWGWINYLFYLKYPPEKIQKEIILSEKNEYGLGWVSRFGKYIFDDFPQDFRSRKGILFVGSPTDFNIINKPLYTVYYPDRSPAFYIADSTSF